MGDHETVKHSESWRAAFEEQATDEAMAQVFAFAASYAAMIENATRRRDPLIARELALDALADTFDGKVTWDPDTAPLVAHLCQVIRSRTSHELDRAKRFKHVSLEREGSMALEQATSDAMAAVNDGDREATASRARRSLHAVRRLAVRDPAVLMLLDAFDEGITDRQGVMRFTGMSAAAYENAVRRMRRLSKKVRCELRDSEIQVTP
jgi:hypothetical protein